MVFPQKKTSACRLAQKAKLQAEESYLCFVFLGKQIRYVLLLFGKLEISFDAYQITDDRLREVRTYTEIGAFNGS